MAADGSIKSRYRTRLHAFVALIALLVFATFSGSDVLRDILASQWTELVDLKYVLSLALPLATFILDGIVTSEFQGGTGLLEVEESSSCSRGIHRAREEDSRFDMKALEEEARSATD